MLFFARITSSSSGTANRATPARRSAAVLSLIVASSLAAGCNGFFPGSGPERVGSEVRTEDFPEIFDPVLWDIDPQIGNAVAGTAFAPDGGRRQGILQLFVAITQNLEAFIAQQEAQVDKSDLRTANQVTTLTRTAPQAKLTQTLSEVNRQTVHTGTVEIGGKTIVEFTHNLDTQAFDGEYTAPTDRNTPHRVILAPLRNGTFVGASAYDVNGDGRALYTHIGIFDKSLRPVKLLQFTQFDGNFADASREMAAQVKLVLEGKDIAPEPPAAPPAAPPAPPAAPPVVVAPPAAPPAAAPPASNGRFPALLDARFFQLDLASQGSPGNSGVIFALVNAVARNAVDDIQGRVDASRVAIERDRQGREVEVRTAPGFESRQTFANDVQEGSAVINGKKRLQFSRNHRTGAFEGIIIAPEFDASAPIAAIVTPKGGGNSSHLIVEDLANNLKNDYRGELLVDSKTLKPKAFTFFEQFQGGLAAQPESAALVKKLGFADIIPGF